MPTLILNRNDACMGVMSLWSTSYFKQAYTVPLAGKELPIFFFLSGFILLANFQAHLTLEPLHTQFMCSLIPFYLHVHKPSSYTKCQNNELLFTLRCQINESTRLEVAMHYGQIHYIREYEKSNFRSFIIGNLYVKLLTFLEKDPS